MTADGDSMNREISIADMPEERAFVVTVDGVRAGKAEYRVRDGRQVFFHTEVDDEFSGIGLGTRLVRHALDDVRSRGGMVVPLCPFFAAYIKRHPEYDVLVDHEMTKRMKSAQRD